MRRKITLCRMSIAKPPLSVGARVAVAALALLGCIGGWLVVLTGGFHHRPYRRADYTIFVDGPALAMAAILFAMATLAVLVLMQHFRATVVVRLFGVCAMLAPPAVYLLAK
jgi:hypothetical protein